MPNGLERLQTPPPKAFVDAEGAYEVSPGVFFHPEWSGLVNGKPYRGPALVEVGAEGSVVRVSPAT